MSSQGTQEWIDERLGFVTASRFSDCLVKPRSKSDVISKTAESYMIDLLGEHITRQPASELKTFAMEWGQRWEPVAREEYRNRTSADVEEVGFVRHQAERFIGCSPDALVGDDGTIEIKCPLTAANHLRVVLSDAVPDEHVPQIQGVLWVTSRQWCDFVSYHDNFPPELRLCVIRVNRDDEFISELEKSVITFRDEMVRRLETLVRIWRGKQT